MKEERKGVVGGLLIAFAVMMLVPLGYRVWIHFNPQPSRPAFSLSKYLSEATDASIPQLLVKSLSKWSETDRKRAPEIAAWLETKDETILPWEWTAEARQKNPEAYFKTWEDILDELDAQITDAAKGVSWSSFKTKWSGKFKRLMNLTNETSSAESELTKQASQADALMQEVVRCQGLLTDIRTADPQRREGLHSAFVQAAKTCLITSLRTLPTLRPAVSD